MEKQLRLISRSRLAVDQWSREHYTLPVIPKWTFSRHIRRRSKYRYADGMKVIDIDTDWCVHCLPNGRRILSILPF